MHLEIEAAVKFLLKMLRLKKTPKPDQLEDLGNNLVGLLSDRYRGHWYPDNPKRGQAYRCIRINPWQYVDESLLQACMICGIEYSRVLLPEEITLWIDPFEVCGRFGEHTDYFTIATFEHVVVTEPVESCPERETSDYSSEGLSSESASESSSDESSGEKPTITKEISDLPLVCTTPDEAIESSSTSKAGSPVNELMALDQMTPCMSLNPNWDVAEEAKDDGDYGQLEKPSKANPEASDKLPALITDESNHSTILLQACIET